MNGEPREQRARLREALSLARAVRKRDGVHTRDDLLPRAHADEQDGFGGPLL